MKTRVVMALAVFGAVTLPGGAQQLGPVQSITLQDKLQIPGTELKPGDYKFAIEDRLSDRAIVRITNGDDTKYTLALSVPNAKLQQAGANGLILFDTSKPDKHVLRGWACPGCSAPLEFVYPKLEAAALTGLTTEPVMAVDPTYDKLPANLSQDDMKVVTLWLMTPKPITANDKEKGVVAAKYVAPANSTEGAQTAQAAPAQTEPNPPVSNQPAPSISPAPAEPVANTQTASVSAPAAPVQTASTSTPATSTTDTSAAPRTRLPKTATNNFELMFGGLLLLFIGGVLHFRNRQHSISE